MSRLLLFAICAVFGSSALAQTALEIIRLKNRTAEQVLPAIEPLIEKGGSLSGQLNTIFIRASAANRAEVKRALDAIDTVPRRLMISVRQDNEVSSSETSVGVGARFAAGGKVLRGSAEGTRGDASDRADQQVQTVDGGQAMIRVGRSLPLQMRELVFGPGGVMVAESLVYRDIGSGFLAMPSLAGERVTVEISPQQESLGPAGGAGAVRFSRIVTTVSGRLGEWIVLGGSGQSSDDSRSSAARYSTRASNERQRVLLRVDALD